MPQNIFFRTISMHACILIVMIIFSILICLSFCEKKWYFQVINHGVPPSVMKDALDAATEFFNLPHEEKMLHASANVHKPVRYGSNVWGSPSKSEFDPYHDLCFWPIRPSSTAGTESQFLSWSMTWRPGQLWSKTVRKPKSEWGGKLETNWK